MITETVHSEGFPSNFDNEKNYVHTAKLAHFNKECVSEPPEFVCVFGSMDLRVW